VTAIEGAAPRLPARSAAGDDGPPADARLVRQIATTDVAPGRIPVLTARQREVLRAYAAAHNTRIVAAQLGITVHTVKFHLKSARRTLGAPDTWAAVDAARARGLL
jgi:DNA-binding NarL/FixJ family response regulator